jgi:hypothetical protein
LPLWSTRGRIAHGPGVICVQGSDAAQRAGAGWRGYEVPTVAIPVLDEGRCAAAADGPHVVCCYTINTEQFVLN